jgi:hypothetical protein
VSNGIPVVTDPDLNPHGIGVIFRSESASTSNGIPVVTDLDLNPHGIGVILRSEPAST